MPRAAAAPTAMLTAGQMTARHARTQRKAPPKAMPQGTPLGRARAQESSQVQATSPDDGERTHKATVHLSTPCAGGDPAHTLSSPRTPQHAPMLETRPRDRPRRRHPPLLLVNLTRALILTCTLTCTALGRETENHRPRARFHTTQTMIQTIHQRKTDPRPETTPEMSPVMTHTIIIRETKRPTYNNSRTDGGQQPHPAPIHAAIGPELAKGAGHDPRNHPHHGQAQGAGQKHHLAQDCGQADRHHCGRPQRSRHEPQRHDHRPMRETGWPGRYRPPPSS